MKLIDALKAGFTVTHYKQKPVVGINYHKENEVVILQLSGARTEYVSVKFEVPHPMLALSATVKFTEELAAAMLLPSGVMPVTESDLMREGANIMMSDAVHQQSLRNAERSMRDKPFTQMSATDLSTRLEAERKAAEMVNALGGIKPEDIKPWTKPKGSF